MLAVFHHHDVLAMPAVPVVAPLVEDFARYLLVLSRNTSLWSLTGFPAISVPCGSVGGLPFAIQLVAPPWREDLLIALGSALQAAGGSFPGQVGLHAGHEGLGGPLPEPGVLQ
jgi:Asp-tRNA(Asn)/Glu-tRNA(Gln) amidotransferase A subunit family amidase